MKVLYTNFHAGDGGGHTTYIRTLAGALASRHEVHVAAPPGSRLVLEARALENVRGWEQPFPNGLNRWAARRRARAQLQRLLREESFDLVHVNGSADHRLVLDAIRGLARPPLIVLTKHNSKPMTGIGHWWRARHTDQVIAVCEYTRRMLLHTAYRRCRLDTVANGVDTDHYRPWPANDALGARMNYLPGAAGALLLAGTATYKGWMDLVEALALLPPPVRGQIHLLIAGTLPVADVQQRISDLGLAGQVHLPGLLDDVRPMIAAIDAGFVMSWDVETISFACREMMSMGKPVLVTEYAGLPENIRAGEDGWCVPPRDRQAMAAVLLRLWNERADLPRMGAAARDHAMAEFGVRRFVDGTVAVYESLLAT